MRLDALRSLRDSSASIFFVSVKFSGLIREAAGAEPQPFSEIWHLETETRNNLRCEVRDTEKNFANDQYSHRYESNAKAVEQRVNAIRAARKEAEELKLEAIPEAEIIARLEKLKADLPAADEFDVTTIPVPDASEVRRGA